MENCKAANTADKLFRSYWKWSKLSLCKKYFYQGLSITKMLYWNISKFIWKYPDAATRGVLWKKYVLRNFTKFTGKHLNQSWNLEYLQLY